MNYKILTIILFTILCQACVVGPQYTPLTQEVKDQTQKVEMYNLVLQDEIKPSVKLSNATGIMGGGLIAVAIDSSVNKRRSNSAQDIIKPLYDITEDFDYRKEIADTYNRSLKDVLPVQEKKATAESILLSNPQLVKKINSLKEGEALLYLSSFYSFFNQSKLLTTETMAFLYTSQETSKKKPSKSLPKPAYYNSIVYESAEVGEGDDESIVLWSENNGELFRKTLKKGLEFNANKLNYDLQIDLNESCNKKVKSNYANIFNINTPISGNLVESIEGRNTIRGRNGILVSTERRYKIPKSKKSKDCV